MGISLNPFTGFLDLTGSASASPFWSDPVATEADLPVPDTDGSCRVVKSTDSVYAYDATTSKWIKQEVSLSASVGSTPNSLGLSLNSTTTGNVTKPELQLQPADTTHPGILSTSAQNIGGTKTFINDIIVDGTAYGNTLDAINTGNTLSIGISNASIINIGRSGATVNIIGSVNNLNATNTNITDALITVNKGGTTGSASNTGLEIEENNAITSWIKTSADRASLRIKVPSSSGEILLAPNDSGFNNVLNSSVLTSDRNYTLPDISGTFVLNAGNQSIAGNKTFSGTTNLSSLTASLPLKLDSSKNITASLIGPSDITIITDGITLDQLGTGSTLEIKALGVNTAQLAANAVTNAKLDTMAANTVKANNTGATATPTDVSLGTASEATSSVLTLSGWSNATIGSPTIQVKQATSTQSGYLSSTDWSTFNNKANTALSNLASVAINQDLIPGTTGILSLGTTTKAWDNVIAAQLRDTASNPVLSFASRVLYDVSGVASVDANNRALKSDLAATVLSWSTSGINANSHLITNVTDPSSAQDAATKNYVDGKFVTGDINPTTFNAANNVSTFTNVTGFAFSGVQGFQATAVVVINATTNLYEVFRLLAVYKGSSWTLSYTSTGDASGVVFDITNAGQVQYKSTSVSGYTSSTIRFRANVV